MAANAQIAVILGLFESEMYDWRSMTTPGITGLFNKNCLSSASENLIMCAPGDNTYDGVQTSVSLVSDVNQFHSIYTTEEVGEREPPHVIPATPLRPSWGGAHTKHSESNPAHADHKIHARRTARRW